MRSLSEKGGTRVGLAGQALALQGLGHHLAREAPPPAEAPDSESLGNTPSLRKEIIIEESGASSSGAGEGME